jgi:hypothetical protein
VSLLISVRDSTRDAFLPSGSELAAAESSCRQSWQP